MSMKVAVVGPGALGCLFAARLVQGGVQTVLVDHREDRARRLAESGVTITSSSGEETVHMEVVSSVPRGQDLCIILVKSYNNSSLSLPKTTACLTLQNGLGHVDQICSIVGSPYVLAGTTMEAATLVGEGKVKHMGSGPTIIGSWTSCPSEPAVQALRAARFDVQTTDAPGQVIWEKAIISSGINPLTALIGLPNGRLLDIPEVRQLMRDLVVEAVKVATTEGYRFSYSLVERAEEVCEMTADNLSSMLQDVRAGKPTEIDAISGEILNRAQLAGLPVPRTRVIWQLVKGLEKR
jgi:2-dehydropantoate 2-reductase